MSQVTYNSSGVTPPTSNLNFVADIGSGSSIDGIENILGDENNYIYTFTSGNILNIAINNILMNQSGGTYVLTSGVPSNNVSPFTFPIDVPQYEGNYFLFLTCSIIIASGTPVCTLNELSYSSSPLTRGSVFNGTAVQSSLSPNSASAVSLTLTAIVNILSLPMFIYPTVYSEFTGGTVRYSYNFTMLRIG